MPDLIRTPGEIKTMVESVFMAQLENAGLSIDIPSMHWFRTLLVEELEHEIFKLLCEEERNAVKNYLKTNKDFLNKQIELYKSFREKKEYEKSDLIRDLFKGILNINL
jgi:hypothetical protein